VADLETTRSARFMVQGEGVEAIVQHYNEKLGAQGWVTREPQSPTDVGQRKWVSTGASAGPSDAFDAAWKNPVTGQTALLSLWHIAGSPEVTHGTFDVYEKGQAP